MARPFIARRLWHKEGPEIRHVGQDFLTSDARPLVVLGEAGMGKSTLLAQLAEEEGFRLCTARHFVNHPDPAVLLRPATTLIIDGLDEVSAGRDGDAVDRIIQKLWVLRCPHFILSCRVADWRGATARQGLKDAYGTSPLELHLEALGREDAMAFLAGTLGDPEAEAAVRHLEEHGLQGLWANPQTLDFVERVAANGKLPDSKGDLFSDAVDILRTEHREEKEATPLAGMPGEEVLDAAGAAFAALILTGKEALSRRAMPAGEDLALAEVRALPGADKLADILNSRLFAASASERFTYAHRAIGEFLGARWLSKQADTPRKRRRLLSLIHEQGLVPASLRGIHAWLAWHGADLAADVVTADPLGIAEYGDAGQLGGSQSRALLRSLERLSGENPQLMGWRRPRFGGLARRELLPEIQRLLSSKESGFGLRVTLLQALDGAAVAGELLGVLLGVLEDKEDVFAIRKWAGVVLAGLPKGPDWTAIIPSLLAEEGDNGPRLAIELGCKVGLGGFDGPTLLAMVLGQLERSEEQVGVFHLFERLLPVDRIDALLDGLSGERRRDGDASGRTGQDGLASLVFGLTARRLEAGPVRPGRFWWWCELFTDRLSPREAKWERIAELVRVNRPLHDGVQRHVILEQPNDGHLRYRVWRLNQLPAFEITEQDAVRLLSILDASDGRWREIILLVPHSHEAGAAVRAAAIRFVMGAEDGEWLSGLAEPSTPDWQIEQQKRAQAARVEERRRWVCHRTNYMPRIGLLRSGNGGMLLTPAQAYLNQFADLRQDRSGPDRLGLWLGPELRDACLEGFEAHIRVGTAPPTATDIAKSHAEGRCWPVAQVTVAALAERHRLGKGFADLADERLAVGLMEFWRSMVAQDAGLQDLDASLAAELRRRGGWEKVQRTYVNQR